MLAMLKSRTVWLALGTIAFGAALTFPWAEHVSPSTAGWIVASIGTIAAVLRLDTVAPVGVKLTRDEITALKLGGRP